MCIYARNLLAMDMCGLDNDTARRLTGDKVCFCISEYHNGVLLLSVKQEHRHHHHHQKQFVMRC